MLRNYILIAWRNLWKRKGFSAINILGLAVGIASCLLIWNYVQFESSYDNFHPDVQNLYRVNQTNIWDPSGGIMGSTVIPLAETLLDNYPEVQEAMRINTPGTSIIRANDSNGRIKAFNENNILAADSNFFSFFGYQLQEGDAKTALVGKNRVVLSPEAAGKFFGDASCLGKILLYGEDQVPLQITGITKKQPSNAHFHFDFLLSLHTNPNIKQFEWSWIWTQVVTYVKLTQETNVAGLEQKWKSLAKQYTGTTLDRLGMDYLDFVENGKWEFHLQPVRSIHLHSFGIGNRLGAISDIKYIYIFSITGFLLLIIAAINFINLSTARGATRAMEVGVKKVLGAGRRSLVLQFQIESLLIVSIASLIGLGIMELFNWAMIHILHFQIPFVLWGNGLLIWALPVIALIVGILAGIYPSFYLTSFRPIEVLKGKLGLGHGNSGLRNGLVVFQFAMAIVLFASTVLVYQQLQYVINKDPGFTKDNLLVINHAEKLGNHLDAYRDETLNQAGVMSASIAMDVPGRGSYEEVFKREGTDAQVPISQVKIDEHFIKTLDLKLLAGRSFEIGRAADHRGAILNETAARLLGWETDQAIGGRLIYTGDDLDGPLQVIGVVEDFHFQSLRENIAPLVFLNVYSTMWGDQRVLAIKFKSGQSDQLVQKLEASWNELTEATPFEYSYFNEEWEREYQSEARLGSLFGFFTILSMLIAMVGLVGLVSYSVEQRKKEIGIRKVLGASVLRIISMMNSQYIKLIILGLILATPIAWWAQQQWLETFAYHVKISPMVFLFAGTVALILALTCVGYLSLRAAVVNPATVLKDE